MTRLWPGLLLFAVAAGVTLAVAVFAIDERGGRYEPLVTRIPLVTDLPALTYPRSVAPPFAEAPPAGKGVVVIDVGHANNFEEAELAGLAPHLAARGFTVDYLGRRDRRDFEPLAPAERLSALEKKLRLADSYVVILPENAYAEREVELLKQFVAKGGRLLLVADPSRRHYISSIAPAFGVLVENDYLYNVKEHETNYQNVFLSRFADDELTRNLSRVVFYTASSLTAEHGLVFTDENTFSSLRTGGGGLVTMARSADRRVVVLSDFTFMSEPYRAIADNNQLLSNLADFLTSGERTFQLSDFPYFFRGAVDIVVGDAALFDLGTKMKVSLSEFEVQAELRGVEDLTRDTVFLGLYQSSRQIAAHLNAAGISINESVRTPFASDVPQMGTAIVFLRRDRERNLLAVLADTKERLAKTVDALRSGDFRSSLVSDFAAVLRLAEPSSK